MIVAASRNVDPAAPILVLAPKAGTLHWAVNDWKEPPEGFIPENSEVADDGIARRTPLIEKKIGTRKRYVVQFKALSEFSEIEELNYTIQYADDTWWDKKGVLKPK